MEKNIQKLIGKLRGEMATRMEDSDIVEILEVLQEVDITIAEQEKDIDFFLRRHENNKKITQELASLNDPRVVAILTKARIF